MENYLNRAFREYDCGENVRLALYENAEKEEFIKTASFLEEKGFIRVQHSEIDNFYGATYEKGRDNVILCFSEKEKELRIIEDSYTEKLVITKNKAGLCPVKLWQFEVDHSLIDCGMCYIIQCTDYSFFVIDSAHFYSVHDDERIYDLLRKNTPASMPVTVRGWFISHGHEDHTSKFVDILLYNKDIIIKGLYYNLVPLDHYSSGCWMQSNKNHANRFLKAARESGIPIYKLHSGQYFYIDSLRFDVLCTHEDVFPRSLENYNDSSTVIMMTAEEDKVIFPGDAGYEESIKIENRYDKFLKSDIVQVSHHGHFGTTPEFYRRTAASVALYATTEIMLAPDMERYEANRIASSIADYSFTASEGTVEFVFPLKDSEITAYPDETTEDFNSIYDLWAYEYTDEFKEKIKKSFESRQKIRKFKFKKH